MKATDPTPDFAAMEPQIARAAALLEMLSQPARLRILCALVEGERPALWLAEASGLSQPAASHHLRRLREEGLVATRRDAQRILYRLDGPEAKAILETLYRLYCAGDGQDADAGAKGIDPAGRFGGDRAWP